MSELTESGPTAEFVEWVAKNLPPNTVISNPKHWASRLWCAAHRPPERSTLLYPAEIPGREGLWIDESGNYYRLAARNE